MAELDRMTVHRCLYGKNSRSALNTTVQAVEAAIMQEERALLVYLLGLTGATCRAGTVPIGSDGRPGHGTPAQGGADYSTHRGES